MERIVYFITRFSVYKYIYIYIRQRVFNDVTRINNYCVENFREPSLRGKNVLVTRGLYADYCKDFHIRESRCFITFS